MTAGRERVRCRRPAQPGPQRTALGLRSAAGRPPAVARPCGRLVSVVVSDECQRQVDTGCDTGGGPDIAVAHVDGIRVDGDSGVGLVEQAALRPVRGRTTALQQPGGRENERPGAHRGDAAGVRGQPSYLGEQLCVRDCSVHVGSSGNHEGVDRTVNFSERGRGELQSAARADRPALRGHDLGVVLHRR